MERINIHNPQWTPLPKIRATPSQKPYPAQPAPSPTSPARPTSNISKTASTTLSKTHPLPSPTTPSLSPSAPASAPSTPTSPQTRSLPLLTRYHAQIASYASHDPAHGVDFARYRVDYHIHLHYLRRRGMLSLCRNADDLHEFREWKWRVFIAAEDPVEARCLRPRRWGWPGDAGLFMLYQMSLWRRGWAARRECVEQARVKWALIVEEYRRRGWIEAWREMWAT